MNRTISEIKSLAKNSLIGKWGIAVKLTLSFFLINTVFPIIVEVLFSGGFNNWLTEEQPPVSSSIFQTIFPIIIIPFGIAYTWFYLSLARNEHPTISKVFEIYKDRKTSLKLIGTSIVIGFFTFLWSLLFIIPGIIKSIAYSQTFFILRDNPEMGVLDAITESRKRMNGYKLQFFLLTLSFIGWGILCLFTLGIGFIWLAPYIYTSFATFYNELIYIQGVQRFED